MRVAFLGLGRMGAPMAAHVVRAGHQTAVWNRSPGRAGELVALGAREAATVADAVADAEVVVTMLFGPEAVRTVLAEAAAAAPRGSLVVECSTIGPDLARELASELRAAAIRMVDAPVAGSVAPARDGSLGVLAGGSAEDYAAAEPLLTLWGAPEKVRHLGPVGAGSAMKLVINLTLGVAIAGVGEALRLAADLGIDRAAALDVLQTGPLGFTTTQKRAMLDASDFSATAFSLDLMAKDLRLCLEAGEAALPTTASALDAARRAVEAGRGGDDYATLAGWIERERPAAAPYFSVVLDSADPGRLAAFYSELLGLPVVWREGAYVVLRPVQHGTAALIFQQVPDADRGRGDAHVDLHVPDVESATERTVELGGQRGEDVSELGLSWRTMRDPDGNPFCLVAL